MGISRHRSGAAVAALGVLCLGVLLGPAALISETFGGQLPTENTFKHLFLQKGHIVGPIALAVARQHVKRKLRLARSAMYTLVSGRRLAAVTMASLQAMCSSSTYDADMRALVNANGVSFDVAFSSASSLPACICGEGDTTKTSNLADNVAFMVCDGTR